jgi:hypothetical protein
MCVEGAKLSLPDWYSIEHLVSRDKIMRNPFLFFCKKGISLFLSEQGNIFSLYDDRLKKLINYNINASEICIIIMRLLQKLSIWGICDGKP